MRKERAALVHGYLKDEGKNRPDRVTRMNLLAAAELLRNGDIDQVFIAEVGEYGEAMRKHIKALLPSTANGDNICVVPTATSTKEELTVFINAYEGSDVEQLLSISNHHHRPRVERVAERIAKRGGKKVATRSELGVLILLPIKSRRYDNLNRMEDWPNQQAVWMKEQLLDLVKRVPGLEVFVTESLPAKLDNLPFQEELLNTLGNRG